VVPVSSKNAEWQKSRINLSRDIGKKRLMQVQRLARAGRLHPDSGVDAMAVRWAQAVLSAPPAYPEKQQGGKLVLKAFLADFVTLGFRGLSNYQVALMDRTDRKHAASILLAHGIEIKDQTNLPISS
jgi:hypothetical protein